jgi:ankyrin repeat protein
MEKAMIFANEIEYWAALGNVKRVRQAIEAGHDVNLIGENGYTALHAAAENNHLHVIRLLIEHGAQSKARIDNGQTPFDLASLAGHEEAAALLRDQCA